MLGAGPLRSRLQAAAARGLTRFVGRETEVEQLRQALGRAAAGHGQLVALVGEPGVGKSRLVWEVTHSHRTHGWLIVQAGSVSYGKATPYLPVIDLLKGYLRIEATDDPRAVREKVTGKLLTLDETLKPTRAGVPGAAGRAGGRRRVVGARPAAAPSADPGGGQAPPPAREPGPAAARRLRGPSLDRRRDPGAPGQSGREPAHGPDAPPRELPPRVRSTAGAARPTTRSSGSTPCRRRAPRPCSDALAGHGPSPSAAQAPPDRAHRGEPVLPGGERPHAGRDEGAGRGARRLPPRPGAPEHSGPGDGPGGPGRADRPAAGRGEAAPPGGRGHRQGRAICAPPGDRRGSRGRAAAGSRDTSRPPSFSTRRASSRTSSTPSSTP